MGRRVAALALMFLGCGGRLGSSGQKSPAPGHAAAEASAVSKNQSPRAPFSGEIVYRVTAIARDSGAARDLGELHYFISGPHWTLGGAFCRSHAVQRPGAPAT